jgi:NAD(P)H-flavin reductase
LNNPFIKGHVGDGLSQYLQKHSTNIKDYKFYLCGSKNAVDSIKSDLISQGALSESIYFEKFT